jgi:YYY domain-containing protein
MTTSDQDLGVSIDTRRVILSVILSALTVVCLVCILLTGAHFRFTSLAWDDWKWIHPDESHMQQTLSKIHTPDDALVASRMQGWRAWAQDLPVLGQAAFASAWLDVYFDTDSSPLNVRNVGDRYSYGTLPLFLIRIAAEGMEEQCAGVRAGELTAETAALADSILNDELVRICDGPEFTGYRSKLVGRVFSGAFDLGTILVVFFIGRRLYGNATGLLAAALMSVTAFLIQQAHFFTVDTALSFFVALTAYFAVRAGQTGEWISFVFGGLSVGMAAACKVSGVYASLMIALAAVVYVASLPAEKRRQGVARSLLRLAVAGIACIVVFRVAQPYAFEGPGFFGVNLSKEWLVRLDQIGNEQSGNVNSPPDQQWANRAPLLFPWLNMVVWGMGLPLGLTVWAGWVWAGVEMWRAKNARKHLILWAWVGIVFIYLGTRWVKSMRYFIYLYPLLAVFGAYLLIRLCRLPRVWQRAVGIALLAVVLVGTVFWGQAVFSIYLRRNTRLAAGQWIYDNVPAGSVLAQEHWDWGPHIPGGKMYTIIEMENYHEDTPDKRVMLYSWLDQTDYIVISSNRIYAVVPRLKGQYAESAEDYRYPMMTEYYRALFAGELGFELAADFTSRPAFGSVQFPDQETPFPLMDAGYTYQTEPVKVVLPPAEEAFSVYDHPRVLIFRKTEAYSHDLVVSLLGDIEVERALYNVKPIEFTMTPDLMKFDPDTWADQQAGGTWSEMFNPDGLLNRYPGLAVIAWWVTVTLLGWLAFPLLYVALPRLRDRGYGFARVFALLTLAYLTWIAASLQLLPNTRGTILRFLGLLMLVGGGVGWFKRDDLRRFVRRERRVILMTEGLFALLFLVWLGIRLLQPDLWHPHMGGEKPMDFAYFNAVIKSTWFPPYNPWFSGGYLNYYYFGFVIVGTLTKLLGTVPAVAYNLIVPLLCGVTGVGAFSVAYNLFGGHRRGALLAGVIALLFAVVLGNLGVVHLVGDKLIELGGREPFPSTIPGFPQTVALFKGLWRVLAEGEHLPIGRTSWYWHPTRIIPSDTGNPIAEFPVFTFLYADLHAHMIAFPLTLFSMALAVYWSQARRPTLSSLFIGGVVVGALRPTNTWDYYPYVILGALALALGSWAAWRADRRYGDSPMDGRALWQRLKAPLLRIVLLVSLTYVLYMPYIQHYAGYSSVERWTGGETPLGIYLWIHAALLFPVVTRLLIEIARFFRWRRAGPCGRAPRKTARVVGLWLALFGLALVAILALATILMLLDTGLDTGVTAGPMTAGDRLKDMWLRLTMGVVPVSWVVFPMSVAAGVALFIPGMPLNRRLLWLMVGLAMGIGIGVELIVVKGDIGRQNTVFKFYLQAWMLLSVAAGVSIAWIRERARRWRPGVRRAWWVVMGLLLFGGALFLPFGVYARATDRMAEETGLTLDGMAFIQYSSVCESPPGVSCTTTSLRGDYEAIRWMQDNIAGSPVIVEGLGWREYLWEGRVSIHTGLPTVVGWRWHEVQQRPMLPSSLVDDRRDDVNTLYDTPDPGEAMSILARYGVRYIYVGEYERTSAGAYRRPYSAEGLAKFDRLVDEGILQIVYDAYGVKIYEVLDYTYVGGLE